MFVNDCVDKAGMTIKVPPNGYYVGCNSDCSWVKNIRKPGLINYGKMARNKNDYVMDNPVKKCN